MRALVAGALVLNVLAAPTQAAVSTTKEQKASPCEVGKLTPPYTKSLAANVLGTAAIVANTDYYKAPCYRAVVDFLIAPKSAGFPNQYEDFYFDSMGNELVDTAEKCTTYRQTTVVYQVQANGTLSFKVKGSIVGSWSGGTCQFHPPTGQTDFRNKKFSPTNLQTHYRLASTVTTGKGIIWGPDYQTYMVTAEVVKMRGLATPRGVCFAVEHPHANNTPVVGCADPTP